VQLHHLTPNAIVQISKFIWAVTSCRGRLTADVFAQHYEMHYQNKKIHLEGCETTLAAQFSLYGWGRYGPGLGTHVGFFFYSYAANEEDVALEPRRKLSQKSPPLKALLKHPNAAAAIGMSV
jgi:hypothetical protein